MLDRVVRFVIGQPVFVFVLTAVLIGFGIRAIMNLPIEAFPDVQDVQVQIITQVPGLAPEEVERSVTLPIEREMSGVPRQTQLRSVTITGLSVVTLTFEDQTDDYFARQQVLEHLANVTLPTGIQSSLAPLSTAVGEIYRYILAAPAEMPENEVRALQDWVVVPKLRIVAGVADVPSFGGSVKEFQVRVDPYALKRYGVTIDQVSQALSANSSNVGGGLMRRGDESLVIRSIGILRNPSDIGRIIVSAKHGSTVLVSDVAEVVIGSKERSGIVAYNERDSVVEGIVDMTKGRNAASVVADLDRKVAEINLQLPAGVKIVPVYRRTDLIHHTVQTVSENLILGAFLVVVVLVLFLQSWRAGLIVAAVIPLSLLFAFILLDAKGIPANLISLGAVDFGIVIDSAVVIVEALMVRLAIDARETAGLHHPSRPQLHILQETVTDLARPILFSKTIIILAFLPIFTFQRIEGKIFTPVAFTLTFALLGALLLTITLVPTLLRYAMRGGKMAERHSRWIERLKNRYASLLHRANAHRLPVVFGSTVVLLLSILAAPWLGSEFLPKLDEGNIWLALALPTSSSIEATAGVEHQVRSVLRSYPEVSSVISQVGRPDDGTDPKGPNNVEMLADLAPRSTWRFPDKEKLVADMSAKLGAIPGLQANFSQVIEDNVEESLSGVKGEIAVKVFGPDLDILSQKSRQIASILKGIRGAADVQAIQISGQDEVDIVIDRVATARLGINIADVNSAVSSALGGLAVNTLFEGDRRFDVTLRLQQPFRRSIEALAFIQVNLPNAAGTIPLGDLARIELRQGASRISRETGERNASVKANLLGRDQGSFVAEAQQAVTERVTLPTGYRISWGGQFENQQRAVKRLAVIVPISILLIFLLLFWSFRSIRFAGLVLVLLPFTFIGGIAGLALAGLHFSVSAAVGFIAVAGISVQNGVIVIEQINLDVKRYPTLFAAAVAGATTRLRPILMTALMAGLGLLPAALSHGIGSETQRPFAVVIVGGIVSATLFTLLLLPILYPRFAPVRDVPRNVR